MLGGVHVANDWESSKRWTQCWTHGGKTSSRYNSHILLEASTRKCKMRNTKNQLG